MELSIRDILQINATIIAGVFILISIMFSGNSPPEIIKGLALFIYFVGGFFSLSGFLALLTVLTTNENKQKLFYKTSIKVMIIGFAVLFIGLASTGSYFMKP